MADWAGLDHDLLTEIVERLPSLESYESFGGVCKSWNLATKRCCKSLELGVRNTYLNQTIFEGIWLMFAENDQDSREFTNVSSGLNTVTRKIYLPEAKGQRYVTFKDWLVTYSSNGIEVSLLHPLSGVQIHLPNNEFNLWITKAVLTANPATNSDYIVVILCDGLRFWKPGNTTWTSIDDWGYDIMEDIIYSNNDNKLYCLDDHRSIFSCDINGPNPTQLLQVSDDILPHYDLCRGYPPRAYLVELPGGEFLVVLKYFSVSYDGKSYNSNRFKILEVSIKDGTCVEVNDLGNKALFLGFNTSFFIECSEFSKCTPNCIYFSDDVWDSYLTITNSEVAGGGKDMGIYRVSDGSFRPLFDDKLLFGRITPPTWIGPSF